jgi:hypothetical protein
MNNACLYVADQYPVMLDDVTIENCASYAVYARGDITAKNSVITNVDRGLYSTYGDVVFEGSTLQNAAYYGLYVNDKSKTLTIRDSTLEGIGYNCGYSRGNLVASDSVVSDCTGWGLYATYAVSVENLVVSETSGYGIGAYYEDMSVTNVELSNIGQSGLYTYNGDLTVDGLEASILGGRAAYVRGSAVLKNMNVSDTNSDGVLVRGPTLEISDCVIENVGRYFLAAQSSAVKITDSTFNNASSIGLRVASLEMMSSTVSGATTGIRIEETTDSTIENSVISDNSVYGVYGAQSTGMGLDVKTSNIMRNGDRGVRYARALDGNYIAENNGSTDVDDTDSGTLDGVYDTSSTQIYGIDIASNPSDVELTGVGGP